MSREARELHASNHQDLGGQTGARVIIPHRPGTWRLQAGRDRTTGLGGERAEHEEEPAEGVQAWGRHGSDPSR